MNLGNHRLLFGGRLIDRTVKRPPARGAPRAGSAGTIAIRKPGARPFQRDPSPSPSGDRGPATTTSTSQSTTPIARARPMLAVAAGHGSWALACSLARVSTRLRGGGWGFSSVSGPFLFRSGRRPVRCGAADDCTFEMGRAGGTMLSGVVQPVTMAELEVMLLPRLLLLLQQPFFYFATHASSLFSDVSVRCTCARRPALASKSRRGDQHAQLALPVSVE